MTAFYISLILSEAGAAGLAGVLSAAVAAGCRASGLTAAWLYQEAEERRRVTFTVDRPRQHFVFLGQE